MHWGVGWIDPQLASHVCMLASSLIKLSLSEVPLPFVVGIEVVLLAGHLVISFSER